MLRAVAVGCLLLAGCTASITPVDVAAPEPEGTGLVPTDRPGYLLDVLTDRLPQEAP